MKKVSRTFAVSVDDVDVVGVNVALRPRPRVVVLIRTKRTGEDKEETIGQRQEIIKDEKLVRRILDLAEKALDEQP